MMKFGRQSKNSQMNTVCLVRVWQNAVDWTRQHLIAVNAGLNAGNRVGHPATVSQKFSAQPTQTFAISPNTWNGNNTNNSPGQGKYKGVANPVEKFFKKFFNRYLYCLYKNLGAVCRRNHRRFINYKACFGIYNNSAQLCRRNGTHRINTNRRNINP